MLSWSTHVSFTLCLSCSVFLSFILQSFLHISFPSSCRHITSLVLWCHRFLFGFFLSCWFTFLHSSFVCATVGVGGSDDCTITSALPHILKCLNSGDDQYTRQLEQAIIKKSHIDFILSLIKSKPLKSFLFSMLVGKHGVFVSFTSLRLT